jgi:hypothetical protein
VTVISPDVVTRIQHPATAIALEVRGKVIFKNTASGVASSSAWSSKSGSINRNPVPTIKVTQGMAATPCIQIAPSQE